MKQCFWDGGKKNKLVQRLQIQKKMCKNVE